MRLVLATFPFLSAIISAKPLTLFEPSRRHAQDIPVTIAATFRLYNEPECPQRAINGYLGIPRGDHGCATIDNNVALVVERVDPGCKSECLARYLCAAADMSELSCSRAMIAGVGMQILEELTFAGMLACGGHITLSASWW